MKKIFLFASVFALVIALVGCSDFKDDEIIMVQPNYKDDWKTTSVVEVSDEILQTCYDIMEDRVYEYDKNDYKAVSLGDMIDYVGTFEGIDENLLDEDDILVQFEAMRIVIDADTNEALGSIPYV